MKFQITINNMNKYINDLFARIYSDTFTVPNASLNTDPNSNILLNNLAFLDFNNLANTLKTARDSLYKNLLD